MDARDESRWVGATPTWLGQVLVNGGVNNPANNALVCSTGTLLAGVYDVSLEVASSVNIVTDNVAFEYRNAADLASNQKVVLLLWANEGRQFRWPGVSVAANERFRLFVYWGFTGLLWGSIWAIQRSKR